MEKTTFMPLGIYPPEVFYSLDDLQNLGLISEEEANEFFGRIHKYNDKYTDAYNLIVGKMKSYLNKYINLKTYYNSNYADDRSTNPEWTCDYNANMMIYSYSAQNYLWFALISKQNDNYIGGVEDTSINIFNQIQNHKIDITEITEEQFIEDANKSILNCINYRKNKLKNI